MRARILQEFYPESGKSGHRRLVQLGLLFGLLIAVAVALTFVGCGGTTGAATPLPPSGPDALGSVTSNQIVDCASIAADAGAPGGTCYVLSVSCPDVAAQDVALKLNSPLGPSNGTIMLTIGGGGDEFYDQHFAFGTQVITDLLGANFDTVQTSFQFHPTGYPDNGRFAGWLSGPGGPRKLACRWSTIAKWVHDNPNIHASNSAFCATGNSAGSAAIGYSLAHYGLDSILNMVEETSGPPMTRLDHGCICNAGPVNTPCGQGALSECYGGDAEKFIDPSYNPTGSKCSNAEETHDTTHKQEFIDDSILAPGAQLLYPNTDVHFVLGGLDVGPEPPQAMLWAPVISAKNPVTTDCVADAGHQLADAQDGAQKVADDLIQRCHQ